MTSARAAALISTSPWDGSEVWRGQAASPAEIDDAIAAAARAFPGWSMAGDRPARLRHFAGILGARRDRIIDLLIRGAGKVAADAAAEADLLPRKIAVTLDLALALTPGFSAARLLTPPPGAAPIEPIIAWRPRGVAAVLGPFNFPLHLLHGLIVPALAVGCTVVAKPSERCPALGALYAELLAEAGLADVCQVVQGDRDVASAIVRHPGVTTVAAVGGRTMGQALARLLADRPEVVLALELGGVNHALVRADADRPAAIAAIADGAWRMAGQRCTATRLVHVPRATAGSWIDDLAAARLRWLPGAAPSAAAGPMISGEARERFQGPYRALPAGLELVAGSPTAPADGGARADPLLIAVRDPAARAHALVAEEQFGPALIVDAYDDEDDAVARMAANPHRLACSVFTADRGRFAALAARLPYGQVNHDRPTAGARGDQPFGGCGQSGNGRPAALAACRIFADETVVW